MTQPDPWAAASNTATASTNTAGKSQTVEDREAAHRALDPNANPFGSESTVGGGGGIRGPQWPDLVGRLIVLKPIEKKLEQPVPNQPNQTQDFYSCDMTVLNGGTLTVITPAKPAQGNNPALPGQRIDYDPPFTFPRWFAYGKGVTVKLDNLTLPLYLGVVRRCPTGPEYRKGVTWQDKEQEWKAYREAILNGRDPAKPQFSWGLVDPTPEEQAIAMEWYRSKS